MNQSLKSVLGYWSDAVCEIKLWLLQLILQRVFGLTLEFRSVVVSERTVYETGSYLNSRVGNSNTIALWVAVVDTNSMTVA
jgi:hypothetical protein